MNNPQWDSDNKQASIFKWADELHRQAKEMFLKDKTHAQILFSFNDSEGLISINPVPAKTEHIQIYNAIRRAINDNNLYAVIHVGECWTYFPKQQNDHTAFQIMDGEIKVSELKPEDKTEALCLRMESREGACVVYLDKIVRTGELVTLGEWKTINDEEQKWF